MAAEVFSIEIPINATDNTDPGVSSATQNITAFDRANQRTQQRLEKMRNTKYRLMLQALDKASLIIGKVGASAKALTAKTWRITLKALDLATAPIRGILRIFKNPLFQIGATIGITVGVADTLNTYVGFEKSMSNVRSLVQMTSSDVAGDMELLTAKAREMGRTTTKTASEAADALGYMALAGWNTNSMLTAIEPTLRLSEAGDLDLARASSLVTDSMSSLGLQANELQGYLDKVAKTAATSNTDIDMLMEALGECGGTAARLNMPLSETMGLLGVLANRKVKGSEAGTALNSILINLTATSGQSAVAMEKLGISAFDAQGNFRGYATVLKDLYEKTKNMTDEQQNYYLSSIGMKMRMSDLQKFLAGVSTEYDSLTAGIEDSSGALSQMAQTKNDNLFGDFKTFTSAADEIKIAFINKLQPKLRSMIQWFTAKMPSLQGSVERFADKVNDKIEWLTKTIQDFTSTPEWENADLFGKIRIAWDKVIAEPFSQWWEASGKAWFAEKARMIGEGIGSGLTMGLMALLGMDVSSAAADGLSIGASFADGFSQGFDGKKIGEAFINAFKGVVKDAGTLLPGGEQASGTSGLSAALLGYGSYKIGKVVYKGIQGGASMWKGLFGGKESEPGFPGGFPVGSAFTTKVMNVTASVVYVNGPVRGTNNRPNGSPTSPSSPTTGPLPPSQSLNGNWQVGSPALTNGMPAALPGFSGTPLALPGGTPLALPGGTPIALPGGTPPILPLLPSQGMTGTWQVGPSVLPNMVPATLPGSGGTPLALPGTANTPLQAGKYLESPDAWQQSLPKGTQATNYVKPGAEILLAATALATLSASDKATSDRERDYKIEFLQSFDQDDAKRQLIKAYEDDSLKQTINKMFSSVGNEVAEQMLDKMFAGFSDKYNEPWFYWGSLNQSGLAKTLGPMIGALSNPHASGGIMTRPHLGLVAEAGPESIIPLSAARRDRGLDLWEQTGRLLGVLPYADGGVPEITPMRAPVPVMPPVPSRPEIKIEVSVAPTVEIQGGTPDIAGEVKRSMKKIAADMADVICNEVARSLSHLYTNKPAGVRP